MERKYTQKVGKKSASKLYKNSIENIFQKEQEIKEIEQKFSTKMDEMENLFRKERIDLLTKIQELEESKKQVVF